MPVLALIPGSGFPPGDKSHQLPDTLLVRFLPLVRAGQLSLAQHAGVAITAGPRNHGRRAGGKQVNPHEWAVFEVEGDIAALDLILANIVAVQQIGVPAFLEELPVIPMLPGGKADGRRLPEPGSSGRLGTEGHYCGTSRVEPELLYVVQTDDGQETLTPEEFRKKYGWKNHPALPDGVVYEGVAELPGPQRLRGETGAQSTIVPVLDALLGVAHAPDPLREYLDEYVA